jgi:hypothetical protein
MVCHPCSIYLVEFSSIANPHAAAGKERQASALMTCDDQKEQHWQPHSDALTV